MNMTSKQITIRMPKADLEAWLAALRLPENQRLQGAGRLYNEDAGGYCCLGAAQCIKTGGYVELNPLINDIYKSYPSLEWLKSVGWEFKDRFGRSGTDDPYLPSVFKTASEINDSGKYSFSEIADIIEQHAEGY